MKSNKTLLLFTYSFPYGAGETFLENEIGLLAESYSKVVIVPIEKVSDDFRKMPPNVEIIDIGNMYKRTYPINLLKKIKSIFSILFTQVINSKRRLTYLKNIRYYFSYLNHKINVAHELYSIISRKQYQNAIYYSYWFDYFMLPLSILKHEKKINFLLTRAHGGDVYEYQHNDEKFFFPFRSFQIKNIDKICPISSDGLQHLKTNYPLSLNKLLLSHLGVNASQIINIAPLGIPIIVTCSTFFSYKRVNLIPEILKHLTIPIKWIHIGDGGNLKQETLNLIKELPKNIEVILKGQLSNSEVLSFYAETPVSLFLNVSLSEGLPVSIMEAISYGIPIIATDVGGVKEIVNEKTGNLLPINFNVKEAAMLLQSNLHNYADINFRNGVKLFWENNFNATKNYKEFIKDILPF